VKFQYTFSAISSKNGRQKNAGLQRELCFYALEKMCHTKSKSGRNFSGHLIVFLAIFY